MSLLPTHPDCCFRPGTGGSGGTLETFDNVRVVSIAGRAGERVDQLRISFIDNYVPSTVYLSSVTIFLSARAEGTYEEYTQTKITRTESIQTAHSVASIETSAEKEFFGSVNTALEVSYASRQQVRAN